MVNVIDGTYFQTPTDIGSRVVDLFKKNGEDLAASY